MDTNQYIRAMSQVVFPMIDELFPTKEFMYVDDGAPCHTSKAALDWKFFQWGHQVLERRYWAPYSPDRNPIEHCWAFMKEEIIRRSPRTVKGLRAVINAAWNSITLEFLGNLFDSLDARDRAIIDANGGHTDF
jgi:hypothetical protein